jgi:hypothetical protein
VGSNPAGRAIRIKQLEPLPAALSIFAARLLRDFSEASGVRSETGAQSSGENSALLRDADAGVSVSLRDFSFA